jgi:hypothetical protein
VLEDEATGIGRNAINCSESCEEGRGFFQAITQLGLFSGRSVW